MLALLATRGSISAKARNAALAHTPEARVHRRVRDAFGAWLRKDGLWTLGDILVLSLLAAVPFLRLDEVYRDLVVEARTHIRQIREQETAQNFSSEQPDWNPVLPARHLRDPYTDAF